MKSDRPFGWHLNLAVLVIDRAGLCPLERVLMDFGDVSTSVIGIVCKMATARGSLLDCLVERG